MGNTQRGAVSVKQIFWIYFLAFALMAISFTADAKPTAKKDTKNPTVVIDVSIEGKSIGTIEVKLDAEKAPISTKNFLKYVDEKFYDGTIFHRVIPTFMIQGGGMTPDMNEKKTTHEKIKNEAKNGLSNKRGTIAMARTSEIDSATAQFYINVEDNVGNGHPNLDHQSDKESEYGYAVFGEVTKGMDVVDKIKVVATGTKGVHSNVPTSTVLIKSIKRKK